MSFSTTLASTSSHPTVDTSRPDASQNRLSPANSACSSELSSLKIRLHRSLRQFPDFPTPGILFEDILPLFKDPTLHESLVRALELHITTNFSKEQRPDIVVGLEARGFLFGPSLALRLGAGFVPVRKPGKLPGPTESAQYEKEYGRDLFQMQSDAVQKGQKVLIIDDIIATGKPLAIDPSACFYSMCGRLICIRRICGCRWIFGEEARRYFIRIHLHSRTRLPQRP